MAEQTKVSKPVKRPTTPPPLKFVPAAELFSRAEQFYDSIARRAFDLFERNGRNLGRDLEHWLRAEAELLHPTHVDISESAGALTVRAEVPGFTSKELEVSVEPRRLTIAGNKETREERKDEKIIYQERCSNQILRVIHLPAEVDAAKVTATLQDGVLELKMPKAAPAKRIPIESKGA